MAHYHEVDYAGRIFLDDDMGDDVVERRVRHKKGKRDSLVEKMIELEMENSHACSKVSSRIGGNLGTGLLALPIRLRRAAMDSRRDSRLQ